MSSPLASRRISRRKVALGIGLGVAAVAAGAGAKLYRRALALGPGRSRALPVASDSKIPDRADAVVIGGGVTGVMAALCLAERGLEVAVCEKGVIGGEASCRSVGMIDSLFLNPAKAQLVLRAKALWPELNARVGGDTGYVRCGVAVVLQSEAEADAARGWVDSVKGQPGLDPAVAACGSVVSLQAQAKCHALLYQPSDSAAEPRFVAPAVALGARAKGATIHQSCAVRGIERSAGAVSAVVTEHGSIKTKIAILAGGAWSPLFCGSLGVDLPQLYAFASNQSVTPAANGPTVAGVCGRTLWRREPDGGYTIGYFGGLAPISWDALRYGLKFLPAMRAMPETEIGIGSETLRTLTQSRHWALDDITPFEQVRIMDATPNLAGLEQALSSARAIHPAFAQVQIRDRYSGALTTTPDNMPVISTVQSIPGLLLGTALYFGLTVCPSAGELLADLATGTTPRVDPKPFRYERLIDGSLLPFQA